MYVYRNIEARSCNHRCSGKTVNITYSECAFLALVTQHTVRMHQNVMWPARLYNTFPRYLINGTIFENND